MYAQRLDRDFSRARGDGRFLALALRLSLCLRRINAIVRKRIGTGFAPRIGRSVSLDHAAELLGVSRRTIYNRIREGRLQTIRTLGGSQRVLIDSVHGESRGGAAIARGPARTRTVEPTPPGDWSDLWWLWIC